MARSLTSGGVASLTSDRLSASIDNLFLKWRALASVCCKALLATRETSKASLKLRRALSTLLEWPRPDWSLLHFAMQLEYKDGHIPDNPFGHRLDITCPPKTLAQRSSPSLC